MKEKLRVSSILIIGVLSLLAAGVILSSNWNNFINANKTNNNILSAYDINTNNYGISMYRTQRSNIIFQINILNRAISKNNIMYQKYNQIFKNNISYIRLQRSIIKNRIQIADSSIKYELNILNNMKTIINNHPYNYLKFFQNKNYIIPQIVSQNRIKSAPLLTNIKTSIKNISNSNVSFKNISYQSEEAGIGIGAITSALSASKTLIFSKENFNYNNIYYFSNTLNNLSTVDKITNYGNSKINTVSAKNTSQFLNKTKTSKKSISDYISKAGLSIFFRTINFYNYLKKNKYEFIAFSSIPIGFIAAGSLIFGKVMLDKLNLKKTKPEGLQSVSRIGENETVPQPIQEIQMSTREISHEYLHNENSEHQTIDTPDRNDYIDLDAEFTDISVNDSIPLTNEQVIRSLYDTSGLHTDSISFSDFRRQVIDASFYRSNPRITSIQDRARVHSYISKYIDFKAGRSSRADTSRFLSSSVRTRSDDSVYVLKRITNVFKSNDTPIKPTENSTTYGWFKMPNFNNDYSLEMTKAEETFINEQIQKFEHFISIIPNASEISVENGGIENVIATQIFNDLHEVINSFKEHLTEIKTRSVTWLYKKDIGKNQIRYEDFFNKFKLLQLQKSSVQDITHLKITEKLTSEDFSEFGKLRLP